MSSDEINLNADKFEDFLYFDVEDGYLIIECNQCSTDDYQFSKSIAPSSGERGWLTKAAIHMRTYHSRVTR